MEEKQGRSLLHLQLLQEVLCWSCLAHWHELALHYLWESLVAVWASLVACLVDAKQVLGANVQVVETWQPGLESWPPCA